MRHIYFLNLLNVYLYLFLYYRYIKMIGVYDRKVVTRANILL